MVKPKGETEMEEKKTEMIEEATTKAVNAVTDQDAENVAGGGQRFSDLICPKCGSSNCYSEGRRAYCVKCGHSWWN